MSCGIPSAITHARKRIALLPNADFYQVSHVRHELFVNIKCIGKDFLGRVGWIGRTILQSFCLRFL